MDRLLLRREKAEEFAQEGFRTAQYHNGKILFQEIEAEATQGWLSQIVDLIAWVEANATICPLTATSDLPEALRLYLQDGYDDILDLLVLAFQKKLLLVSDDLPTREIGRSVGLGGSAWLHIVFGAALKRGVITSERYVRVASHLIGCGHSYLGIAAPALALALRMDAKFSKAPGPLFQSLTRVLGAQAQTFHPISEPLCSACALFGRITPLTPIVSQPQVSFCTKFCGSVGTTINLFLQRSALILVISPLCGGTSWVGLADISWSKCDPISSWSARNGVSCPAVASRRTHSLSFQGHSQGCFTVSLTARFSLLV